MFRDYVIIPIQSSSGMATQKRGSGRVLNREVVVANYSPGILETLDEVYQARLADQDWAPLSLSEVDTPPPYN